MNSGDIEQLMELYEPGALLAPMPGARGGRCDADSGGAAGVCGSEAEDGVQGLCFACRAGSLRLCQSEWTMVLTTPDGPITQSGRSVEIARRQADGSWKYVVDHPWGGD